LIEVFPALALASYSPAFLGHRKSPRYNPDNAQWTMIYTTPASGPNAGTVITFQTIGLQPLASGVDWDFGANYQDNDPFFNKCGFYEYFYTAEGNNVAGTGKGQVIGYAVSNSPFGPWWKYTGPIIPPTSPMYFGQTYIGNSAVNVANGRFIWSGNTSNGTTGFTAAAIMQDACSY
jgi:hypothetical protein